MMRLRSSIGCCAGIRAQFTAPVRSEELRREASESWKNFIRDEVVYLGNSGKRNCYAGISLTENYHRGESWFEILIGTSTDYVAAIIRRLHIEQQKIGPR